MYQLKRIILLGLLAILWAGQNPVQGSSQVDSWWILKDAKDKVAPAIRRNTDELDFVRKYADENPNANIADEITEAGGYRKWKATKAGFGKYATRFDDKVEVLAKEELFGDQASTFLDAEYRTVRSTEELSVRLSKNGSNLKLSDASGNTLGEFRNGKLLPEKYDFDTSLGKHKPGGIAVGDVQNGYQLFKHGDEFSVRRIADESPYSASELTELTQHPRAHVLERHSYDVTDDALIKRANYGIAPDGSNIRRRGNIVKPPHSSKFWDTRTITKSFE